MSLKLASNTLIDDRYEIIRILGEGGMGSVYEARQVGLERRVAIKILHSTLVKDEESIARFEREALVLSGLSHKNLGTFYSYGIWQKMMPYIAMEFIDGESLSHLISTESDKGKLDVERLSLLFEILLQVADALAFVHEKKILHRDLKPNNILVTKDGLAKIVDFGLAKMLAPNSKDFQKLTQTGMLMGTAQYMSPELCKGESADHRADIYSVGCILYECITGRAPHVADNPIGLMSKHVNEAVIAPSKVISAALPEELDDVVLKALAKSPEDRYSSIDKLKQDLEKASTLLNNASATPGQRVTKNSQISKKNSAIILVSIAALAVGVAFFTAKKAFDRSRPLESETISETKAQRLLVRANNLLNEQNDIKPAVTALEEILKRKISRNEPNYKLQALAMLMRVRNNDSDLQEALAIAKRSLNAKSKLQLATLYAINYALSTAIMKCTKQTDYDKAMALFALYDQTQKNVERQTQSYLDLGLETFRRKILLSKQKEEEIVIADNKLKQGLERKLIAPECKVIIDLICFQDSVKLGAGRKETSINFEKFLESLNSSKKTALVTAGSQMYDLFGEDQKLKVLNTCLNKTKEEDDDDRHEERIRQLYPVLLSLRGSWAKDGFRKPLDRLYQYAYDAYSENSPTETALMVDLASAYCSQNEPRIASRILNRVIDAVDSKGFANSKIMFVLICTRAINQKELTEETLSKLQKIYVDCASMFFAANDDIRYPLYVTNELTNLIQKKKGLLAAAEFKRKTRKQLKENKIYDKISSLDKMDLLRIAGAFPNNVNQPEFAEIQQITNATTDDETKCFGLVTMYDAYANMGDTENATKCLDLALQLKLPDQAGLKRWAIFHRGRAYDRAREYEQAERMLWRALNTFGTPSTIAPEQFKYLSDALVEHYKRAGNKKLSNELKNSTVNFEKFFALCPKTFKT